MLREIPRPAGENAGLRDDAKVDQVISFQSRTAAASHSHSSSVRYNTRRWRAVSTRISMSFAGELRRELAVRAQAYAHAEKLPHCLSYGENPITCFAPYGESRHGNFLRESYRAILANPAWKRRLEKVHTQARRSLPITERGRWRELDSCTSSDALLMNVFCFPGGARDGRLSALLGAAPGATPRFGYKARVPLVHGRFDRTEIDLRLGDLLIEAKLTESDFQSARKEVLVKYRDFADVFESSELPQTEDRYLSYQLLRNVLAAHALQSSFCVLVDGRRPDLIDAWYAVMKCVKPVELRTRLRISTWQEVAREARPRLRTFLVVKYGIVE
jgi:Restriction Endonuclease associating with ARP